MYRILVLLFLITHTALADQQKPNLVVIMCDELGYADVGVNGFGSYPFKSYRLRNPNPRFGQPGKGK